MIQFGGILLFIFIWYRTTLAKSTHYPLRIALFLAAYFYISRCILCFLWFLSLKSSEVNYIHHLLTAFLADSYIRVVQIICKKNRVYSWSSRSHFGIFYRLSIIKIFFLRYMVAEPIEEVSDDLILVIVDLKFAVKDYLLLADNNYD